MLLAIPFNLYSTKVIREVLQGETACVKMNRVPIVNINFYGFKLNEIWKSFAMESVVEGTINKLTGCWV